MSAVFSYYYNSLKPYKLPSMHGVRPRFTHSEVFTAPLPPAMFAKAISISLKAADPLNTDKTVVESSGYLDWVNHRPNSGSLLYNFLKYGSGSYASEPKTNPGIKRYNNLLYR